VVRPFDVGALGGWHPGNEQSLNDLGIPRYWRKLLLELCVADAIVGSKTIWARIESGMTDRRETTPASALGRCGTARIGCVLSPQPLDAPLLSEILLGFVC